MPQISQIYHLKEKSDYELTFCTILAGRVSNSVRVINRQNSSDRALLKGFSGAITDVAFSHAHQSNLLAAVDNVGNFLVWTLNDAGGNIE